MKLINIPIKKIRPNPIQPRETFSKASIKELANSIDEANLLQPIVVRKVDGNYQIVAGERRWRAFSMLKRKSIPAVVWKAKDDIDALEKSAIENLQREDLTSVERENVITELWESGKYRTQEELARKIGLDRRTITEYVIAKEDRKKLLAASKISTRTIIDTSDRKLTNKERKEIIKKVERGTIAPSRVRNEVRRVKLEKEIKKEFITEVPIELKKASFIIDFRKNVLQLTKWFELCNKVPLERAFNKKQMKQMENVLIELKYQLGILLNKLEEVLK